jgi:hypothetical protein
MKRGLIRWDREALPPSVFEARMGRARKALADRDLPALVVYSDVARSGAARHLTNFMPYWNRSLAIIPRDDAPILLCALSPRVYPWIRSITVFEEIRPASRMIQALTQLCEERGWKRIGVLDLPRLVREFHLPMEAVDVPSAEVIATDESEVVMHRKAAKLARQLLEEQLPNGAGRTGHELAGALEREFRRAGAEDLVIRISDSQTAPAPASGVVLGSQYSLSVALEYCGHWVKVTRPYGVDLHEPFAAALREGTGERAVLFGSIYALHIRADIGGHRFFHGDTCYGSGIL